MAKQRESQNNAGSDAEGDAGKAGRRTKSVQMAPDLARMAKIISTQNDEPIDRVLDRHCRATLTAEYKRVVAEMSAEQRPNHK